MPYAASVTPATASRGSQPAWYAGSQRAGGKTARQPRAGGSPNIALAGGASVLMGTDLATAGRSGEGPRSLGAQRDARVDARGTDRGERRRQKACLKDHHGRRAEREGVPSVDAVEQPPHQPTRSHAAGEAKEHSAAGQQRRLAEDQAEHPAVRGAERLAQAELRHPPA